MGHEEIACLGVRMVLSQRLAEYLDGTLVVGARAYKVAHVLEDEAEVVQVTIGSPGT